MIRILTYWALALVFFGAVTAAHALTVDPEAVSMASGETVTLQLSDGSGYYNIQSSDDAVARVSFIGDQVTVTGMARGRASITIEDGNVTITVPVDVDPPVSASSTDVFVLEGESQVVAISNGTPPYFVDSVPLATAVLDESSLTITGVLNGTTSIIVTDSVSDSVTIDVVVYLPLETDTREIFMTPDTGGTINVNHGVPPYSVVSDNNSIANASVDGTAISVAGVSIGTAHITISDSAPTPNTIVVTAGVNTFNISTHDFHIHEEDQENFEILGAGYYNVTVANDTILSARISDNFVIVTGLTAGSTTITLTSSSGESIDLRGTVYGTLGISRPDFVMDHGTSESLGIVGGVWPYTISSSVQGIVEVPDHWGVVPFDVYAAAMGSTVLSVVDSLGNSVDINITVQAGALHVTTSELSVAPGSVATVGIFGGTGYYTAFSSDLSVVDINLGENELYIIGFATGRAVVRGQDSNMDFVEIAVTTLLPAPQLVLEINSNRVSLEWDAVAGADSYILYYAPPDSSGNPDLENLGQVDLGNSTSLDVEMETGDAYFVAIQAIDSSDPGLTSQVSNIVDFTIP